MSRTQGQQWLIWPDPNMILEEKLYNSVSMYFYGTFSNRGKTFSLGEVNQISSISKIRYDPCHQHISYPKHRIFFQCSSECLYSGLSSEFKSSLVLGSVLDTWRWPRQHALTYSFKLPFLKDYFFPLGISGFCEKRGFHIWVSLGALNSLL